MNTSESRIRLLHPKISDEVLSSVNQANAQLTGRSQVLIVQGWRTFEEQTNLFNQRPKVTNAKAGQSYHNYGLAVDFALLIDGKTVSWDVKADWNNDHISDWMQVVKVFKDAGYTWGGDWTKFKDLAHFEKTFGYNWKQLLAKYRSGDFIPGTRYLNI